MTRAPRTRSLADPARRWLVPMIVLGLSGCAVTPTALSPEEVLDDARDSMATLAGEQSAEPIDAPVDVHEAIVRTIKYNRDKRVRLMTAVLEQQQTELASFDMLPRLTVEAGYEARNNQNASSSRSLITGAESLEPSISSNRHSQTASATFSWNVLDFGISYVRAKQQGDRYLIARERERKVVHTITQEARDAYWRAVSAERLLSRIEPLRERVQMALEDSRKIEQRRLQDPMEALGYQRELLEALRTLQNLKRSLVGARTELATLMGLPPAQRFQLAMPVPGDYPMTRVDFPVAAMERTALVNRPELMEARYAGRIARGDAHAALLRLLPGIELSAGARHDSNSFLVNDQWNTLGGSVVWNLLDVFRYPAEKKAAEAREALVREQGLAMHMAVLSQVHLANVRLAEATRSYEVARDYHEVVERMLEQTSADHRSQRSGEMQLIRTELNHLVAELRRDVAYAELQNSFVQVFVSMGLDPVPDAVEGLDLESLAAASRRRFQAWLNGEIELVDDDRWAETPELAGDEVEA